MVVSEPGKYSDHNPHYHYSPPNWDISVGFKLDPEKTDLEMFKLLFGRQYLDKSVQAETTTTKDEGMYLTKNGDQHKCELPEYTWERGSNLKNVWMCECGKRYRLRAHQPSERDLKARETVSRYDRYRLNSRSSKSPRFSPEELEQFSDTRKALSMLDILTIGNQVLNKTVWNSGSSGNSTYEFTKRVPMTSEEIINEAVVFTWERITRKPKAGKA